MNTVDYFRPWRSRPAPSLTVLQKQWLTRPGALTAALRELGKLELRVLAEYPAGARPDEAHRLLLTQQSPVWVREIVMVVAQRECVVARSVTPLQASHGVWQGVRKLRNRPLADILYDDVAIVRSNFEVAQLHRQTPLFKTVTRLHTHSLQRPLARQPLLARRSAFWRQGSPLLVAECFLPEFWTLFKNQPPGHRDGYHWPQHSHLADPWTNAK
ncbi:MAG: chorismate lyase [Burkholderiales bacterium]|jgi:chorismate lyase|nr:chorismate lyase [Burkholderiales bacterium]MDP4909140.1 chorismate lyase [Burkholderiaceae bacterium]